jgi:hypothetical protein
MLYAGGGFTTAGNVAAGHIARWDGSSWSVLGSGVSRVDDTASDPLVQALAIDHTGTLYAGGIFHTAGNKPSYYIAHWDDTSVPDHFEAVEVPSSLTRLFVLNPPYPNPFEHHTTLELIVHEPQHVDVSVFDVSGRHVRQLHDGFTSSNGAHRILFDGNGLPSGTYFVRVAGEAFSASNAVVLVR